MRLVTYDRLPNTLQEQAGIPQVYVFVNMRPFKTESHLMSCDCFLLLAG
jgi:hypothetical protein